MESGDANWSRPDALNALIWLMDAGVDTIVADEARPWLRSEEIPTPEIPARQPVLHEIPAVVRPGIPMAVDEASPLIIEGKAGSPIALIMDADLGAGGRHILAEPESRLLARMMAAIGLDLGEVIRLGIAEGPGGDAVRAQIAAHSAPAMLLFGDGPSKLLLGKPVAQARGQVHRIALGGIERSAVAVFAPHFLMQQPQMKALAWTDLRLFAKMMAS